jgi:hypothetical protein
MEKKEKKIVSMYNGFSTYGKHVDKPSQLMVMRVGLWLNPAIDNGYFGVKFVLA